MLRLLSSVIRAGGFLRILSFLFLSGLSVTALAETYAPVRTYYTIYQNRSYGPYPTFERAAKAAWDPYVSIWSGVEKDDWFSTGSGGPECKSKAEPTSVPGNVYLGIDSSLKNKSTGVVTCSSTSNSVHIQLVCPGGGNLWYGAPDYQYLCVGAPDCPSGQTRDTATGQCSVSSEQVRPEKRFGSCGVGNPCDPTTGNKYQIETDYNGGEGLPAFVRHYNSQLKKSMGLGLNWTYVEQLEIKNSLVWARTTIGRTELFNCSSNGTCVGDVDTRLTLGFDASGYTLTHPTGTAERYSTKGLLQSHTDAAGRVTTYGYDSGDRLTSIRGPNGHVLTLAWPTSGPLTSVTTPAGGVIRFTYTTTSAGKTLTRVDYPDDSAKLYHYENASFPAHLTGISYVDSAGSTSRYSSYSYDANGKAVSTEHSGGMEKFTLAYDSSTQTTVRDAANATEVRTFAANLGVKNLVAKTNQADGKAFVQTFDVRNNLTCQQDEEGRVATYAYNSTNQKTSETVGLTGTCAAPVTTGATRTTSYTYKSATRDLPTKIESPSVYSGLKKATAFTYGNTSLPNLPTVITQSGYTPSGGSVLRSVALSYNSAGKVTSIDGPRTDASDVTTFTYMSCTTGGACGQLASITNALGHVITFDSYDANGRLIQLTDPNGLRTSYQYDASGRVRYITQTPSTGTARVTEYRYNAAGDVTSVVFPDGQTLVYTYSAARKLTQVTDALGNKVVYGYDLKGNRTAEYTYDASNTLVRQIDLAYDLRNRVSALSAAGSVTQQVHDAVGNLRSSIDANTNPATTYQYDALNRLLATVNALGGTTSVAYDVNDRLKQVSAPNSATTQYQYDDLGNLLTESSPDRGTTSYGYDAAGNLTSKTDARGIATTYGYDALNRLTTIDRPGTSEDVSYTYDTGCASFGVGRFCQLSDVAGSTQYGYDAFGNLTQQVRTELGVSYTTAYTYDAANRVSSFTYPDGRVVTYTRDGLGRLSGVTATVNGGSQTIVSNRGYRADGLLGTQSFGNGLTDTRLYDLQGRLREHYLGSADTRLYSYDANGNVTSFQSLPQVGSYQYDALDRLTLGNITSAPSSSVSFSYDGNGNRLSDGTSGYSYLTNSNRLTQAGSAAITTDAAGNVTGDGTYTYAYNHDGHIQSVSQGGTTLGTYFYNHLRQRTRKVVGSTTTVYHYDLYGNLILETSNTGTSNVAYVYAERQPIAHIARAGSIDTLTYLHTDHEGTARLGTKASDQTVVWRWEGNAFGDTAAMQNPDGDGITVTNHLRYPGQYYDSESGLFYNHHRYYSPALGRYISSDPIGLAGGLNTYAYVANNPLRWTDPDGLVVRVVTSDPKAAKILMEAYARMNTTKRGREISRQLECSKEVYEIRPVHKKAFYCPPGRKECRGRTVYMDPYNTVLAPTTAGLQPMSKAAMLGHELGHAIGYFDGVVEVFPEEIFDEVRGNNVEVNENPIRQGLGEPLRTGYGVDRIEWVPATR